MLHLEVHLLSTMNGKLNMVNKTIKQQCGGCKYDDVSKVVIFKQLVAFSRMKYDDIIKREDTSGQSTLTLTGLKEADSGLYKCRANNDYSSQKSKEVQIKVKGIISNTCTLIIKMPKHHHIIT